MARKLASIVEIGELQPIEGADKIEVAIPKGKGWKVVVGKGDFHVGDLAVMFEIDSFLDPNDERYAFLRDRCLCRFVSKSGNVLREGLKIKTIKLRGVISQGLLMPLYKFVGKELHFAERPATPDDVVAEDGNPVTNQDLEGVTIADIFYFKPIGKREEGNPGYAERVSVTVGSDLTEVLHVEHYDEVKEQLRPDTGSPVSADAMGKFPSDFAPKTDEPRLQGLTDYFETQKGKLFEVTEKRDGSSISFGYCPVIDAENPFMVCSRNLRLKPVKVDGGVPMMWKTVTDMGLEEKCKTVPNLMFQAEFCGMGVNKNRDKLNEYTIEVFRIYDVKKQEFVEVSKRRDICKSLMIPHVPVIDEAMDVFNRFHSIDEILPFADGKTARGNKREGLVFKEVGTTHPCSFKVVSNQYLLSEKD